MKSEFFKKDSKNLFALVFIFLIIITISTSFYGIGDNSDYSDVAKFFAGDLHAKVRSSHSYFWGFLTSPLIKITQSFFIFKLINLFILLMIILSVYIISNKDKKALWIMLLCPVVWYSGPSMSPLQIASLFFIWAYYFMDLYDKKGNLKFLIYSGLLCGLGWVFWDSILFFTVILGLIFLFNKKFSHFIIFLLFLFIGLSPRLVLDQYLFGFPFFSIFKSFLGALSMNLAGGIYSGARGLDRNLFTITLVILATPIYFWIFFKKLFFKEKKSFIFLLLSFSLIILNPQIRYVIALAPIMTILLSKEINDNQFKKQIIFSILVILIFISPYLVQINNSVTPDPYGADISSFFKEGFKLNFSDQKPSDLIISDLNQLTQGFPNQTFVIGNEADTYVILSSFYWKDNVKEFVSIQDYNLYFENKSVIFQKTWMPQPKINERRKIWISGGLNKNDQDSTNYTDIKFGIGYKEPVKLDNFKTIKKYNLLYLSVKEN